MNWTFKRGISVNSMWNTRVSLLFWQYVEVRRFALFLYPLLLALGFIFLACSGISRLGIQTDEALFAGAIYPPFPEQRCIQVFGLQVPLMVFDYIGSLKSALYVPIFAMFGVSATTVRIPAILIGAATILICFVLMQRLLGARAAWIAALLLAADPMFLLTVRGDWGPVALQIALKAAALLALVRFGETLRPRWLAAGFFFLGLGLWDKALFVWSLVGLAGGGGALFARRIAGLVTRGRALTAILAFLAGCSPLLVYNVRNDWVTFRGNSGLSLKDSGKKLRVLHMTLSGEALRGYMARAEPGGFEREPSGTLESASVRLATSKALPRSNFLPHLLLPCLLLVVLVRGTHGGASRFFLAAGLITWLMMLITHHAGGAVHHTILIYPFPQMFIGAVLSSLAEKRRVMKSLISVAVGIVACSGIATTLTYYADEFRFGGTPVWSDAFYGAMHSVRESGTDRVCLLDWGFYDNTRLFLRGRVGLCTPNPAGSEQDANSTREELRMPNSVYVAHVPGEELVPGSAQRFLEFAAAEGYEPAGRKVFRDRTGRPVIETFTMQPVGGGTRSMSGALSERTPPKGTPRDQGIDTEPEATQPDGPTLFTERTSNR